MDDRASTLCRDAGSVVPRLATIIAIVGSAMTTSAKDLPTRTERRDGNVYHTHITLPPIPKIDGQSVPQASLSMAMWFVAMSAATAPPGSKPPGFDYVARVAERFAKHMHVGPETSQEAR